MLDISADFVLYFSVRKTAGLYPFVSSGKGQTV